MMTSLIIASWIQRKISIRNAFTSLLFWFLSFIPWDHAFFLKEHQQNMWNKRRVRLCNVEKDLPKMNSTVVFLMHSEWSDFWILANFGYVIFFYGFEKITLRYKSKFACFFFSYKIDMHNSLVHMHGLWKSVKWVISAPLMVHCECVSVSSIVFQTDPCFRLIWNCSCCKALQIFISSLNPKSLDYTVEDSKL